MASEASKYLLRCADPSVAWSLFRSQQERSSKTPLDRPAHLPLNAIGRLGPETGLLAAVCGHLQFQHERTLFEKFEIDPHRFRSVYRGYKE